MRLIVLVGLVSVEKIQLTIELAKHFTSKRKTVTIVDNVSRLHIEADAPLYRIEALSELNTVLRTIKEQIILFAVSETVSPEMLLDTLDELTGIKITTLAMIDTRTCECFPNLRVAFEDYADVVVNVPYELSEVVWGLSNFLS
jgi:hypothetical protein